MKKNIQLFTVALIAGLVSLGGYKLFFEELNDTATELPWQTEIPNQTQQVANFTKTNTTSELDFTEAAEKTVNSVVHVKNVTTRRYARTPFEYYFGSGGETQKAIRGAGSGVIVSPDGLIVTNNHVIEGASEIQVTLNNNKTYVAEILGTAPENDIALLKIEASDLEYLTFGDSDQVNLGEWVLAVGNPFNLTSTVTAGIVSAKARDLDQDDSRFQSFIQTDAAVNPGNSGGALVNTRGELIGINTAITSQTGSFIGYSFAIPSNNAKKIVEDLIEYGDVRKAVLGVRGTDLNSENAEKLDVTRSQGFYIANVETDSGAEQAGLKEGDIITEIDNIDIRKFSDMVGYLSSKNPGETVEVNYYRNGKLKSTQVKLDIFKTYKIEEIGLEVTNADESIKKVFGTNHGVLISKVLPKSFTNENIAGLMITKINDEKVYNIEDVENILKNKSENTTLNVTFLAQNGQEKTYVFR
ncbi:trypsin-like peptidase domain-containing protein [Psychroflexus aestuariivivens]|uniref:trypsin-like peptidase domain-containing protein n=1 Tax=Psychroflexus aestuariivivens TaxID=1795040 RepID=UPI000FDBF35D|nr:trypsin-like peptidase domain-containing protein [Psychroflexus aestuariivivens]